MEDFEDMFPSYPVPGDEHFSYKISIKREFKDLGKENIKNKMAKELLNHQKASVIYLSPMTPFTGLGIIHEPGTGKTFIASSVAEEYSFRVITPSKRHEFVRAGFGTVLNDHRAIFISNRTSVIENFKSHLVKFHDYTKSGTGGTKRYDEYYEILSAGTFASKVAELDERIFMRKYSYRVVIIDEIQTIKEESEASLMDTLEIKSISKQIEEDNLPSNKIKELVERREKILKKLKKKTNSPYNQIRRLLKQCDGLVVMLLSATIMQDKPDQITKVVNLILPKDKKIDKKIINSIIYSKERMESNQAVDKNKLREYLYPRISGYISYMRSSSAPKIEQQGETMELYPEGDNPIESQMKVFRSVMQPIQYRHYAKIAGIDNLREESEADLSRLKALYIHDRDAANFVFCDKNGENTLSGTKGLNAYTKKVGIGQKQKIVFKSNPDNNEDPYYGFGEFLMKDVYGALDRKTGKVTVNLYKIVENIAKVSCKYAATIKYILDNPKRPIFVYSDLVRTGGALLGLLLELVDFVVFKRRGRPPTGSLFRDFKPARRYILITSKKGSVSNPHMISAFNEDINRDGDYIQVAIGSRTASISISFVNVRDVHLVSPSWTPSHNTQVEARPARYDSLVHYKGTPEYKVNVFRHVASIDKKYFKEGVPESIDEYMYRVIEEKDRDIKPIERVLKEISFDCYLNKYATLKNIEDNTKEADYEKAIYQCIGYEIDVKGNKLDLPDVIDESSYVRYFLDDNIHIISRHIIEIFMIHHILPLNKIIEFLKRSSFGLETTRNIVITPQLIVNALKVLITSKYRIRDRYGNVYFLKQENDILYLSNSHSGKSDPLEIYYAKRIQIDVSHTVDIFRESVDKWVSDFAEDTENITSEDFIDILTKQQRQSKIIILEKSLTDDTFMDEKRRNIVMDRTRYWWIKTDNYYAHFLLQRSQDSNYNGKIISFKNIQKTRVYSKQEKKWRKATFGEDKRFINIYNERSKTWATTTRLKYKIYGTLLEGKGGKTKFRVVDLSTEKDIERIGSADRRREIGGTGMSDGTKKDIHLDYLWELRVRVGFPSLSIELFNRNPQSAIDGVRHKFNFTKEKIEHMKNDIKEFTEDDIIEKYNFTRERMTENQKKLVSMEVGKISKVRFYYEWLNINSFTKPVLENEIRKALDKKNLIIREF